MILWHNMVWEKSFLTPLKNRPEYSRDSEEPQTLFKNRILDLNNKYIGIVSYFLHWSFDVWRRTVKYIAELAAAAVFFQYLKMSAKIHIVGIGFSNKIFSVDNIGKYLNQHQLQDQ